MLVFAQTVTYHILPIRQLLSSNSDMSQICLIQIMVLHHKVIIRNLTAKHNILYLQNLPILS